MEIGGTELKPGAEPKYKFKNVIMVSSCWSEVEKVKKMVETARGFGTKFYACYGDCDIGGTIPFAEVHMKEYLEIEPWKIPSIGGHTQTVWDAFTYDGDGNGKADIFETIFGNSSEEMEDDTTDKNGEIDSATEPELEPETLNEQDLGKQDTDKTVGTYRRPPEKPNYDFAKVCKIAMQQGIPFKSGEKPSEFIKRVAEELNIPTTTLQEGTFGEAPVIDQLAYPDIQYGSSNIRSGGCGACAAYSLGVAKGKEVMDARDFLQKCSEILQKSFPNYKGGTPGEFFQNEEFLALSGLKFEGKYAWGEAFNNNRLDEDLEKGNRVICQTTDKAFAVSGHYMGIIGKTEDGKYIVRDSDSANWSKYKEQYENGFSADFLKAHIDGSFYSFGLGTTETTKDDNTLLKEILEASGYELQNSTEEPNKVSVDEPKETKLPEGEVINQMLYTTDYAIHLADKYEINTEGKTDREIMEELAIKLGVDEEKKSTIEDKGDVPTTEVETVPEPVTEVTTEVQLEPELVTEPTTESTTEVKQIKEIDDNMISNIDMLVKNIEKWNNQINEIIEKNKTTQDLTKTELEKENTETTTVAYKIQPEKATEGFVEVCKIAMERGIPFTSGETPSKFISRVAKELNIQATTNGKTKDYETLIKEILDKNKDRDIDIDKDKAKPNGENAPQYPEQNLNKPSSNTGSVPTADNKLNIILKAAENFANETSASNYICLVLNQAGYLTKEQLNEYKNYNIDDIFKKFDELGWKKITNIKNFQVGDVVLIDNNGKKIVQIYAGNNKWYIQGKSKTQELSSDYFDNLNWEAYRPQK